MLHKDNSRAIPTHVGIIMDGNGRWATLRGHKRSFGHKQGAKTIKKVIETLYASGVEFVSLYAFSTENFARPKEEVDFLFDLLKDGIKDYGEQCLKKGVKLVVSGDLSVLNDNLVKIIQDYAQKTQAFSSPVLNICLNYGARQELCRAFNLMQENNERLITPQTIEKYLYNDLPPIDLMIRSGGEKRLSNFMLWQCAYAELYFTDTLWPDFTKEDCLTALDWFASRKRRFGKVE